jgi:hypothetical protein
MDRDIKLLGNKKRVDIVGRKITIILVFSGLPWDLRLLPEIIVFSRHFDHGRPRDIKILGALQVNGSAFKISVFCNALEEVPDIDTNPKILDLSCIK